MADNDWYVGHILRIEAEKKLLHPLNDHGAYLIRCSESYPGDFSLSLRDRFSVKHYRIRQTHSGYFTISGKTFSTLQELVDSYAKNSNGLCVNLRKPCIKFEEIVENYSSFPNVGDSYETDRATVKRVRKLGIGQFGEVWEGLWSNKTPVAIKTLRLGTMDPSDFLAEAQIMKNLKHPNLIQLFAVCTLQDPIYILTELMINGSVLRYLREKKRTGNWLQLPEIIRIAGEVCCGMAYLEKQNYIHRDLAARNVLLGQKNVVKIADFGLARLIKEEEYQARLGTKFPIKWTAPEAISNNVFSVKSDVWSFGILLTELVTHGDIPYGEEMSNLATMAKVEQGYRMSRPQRCPQALYDIMVECWDTVPMNRPTFDTLQWKLDDYFTIEPTEYKEATGYQDVLQ